MDKGFRRTGIRLLVPALAALLLGGCSLDVLNPQGLIGIDEKQLILTSTWAMLIVVIPVILMTLIFAWRYRASNTNADYQPKWSHSISIEVVVWTVPSLIILFLAIITWSSTHRLDPYRPLASDIKPMDVEVVSLDWKWLFIYPNLGIASVNQLAMPVGTPVDFHITSDTVMNSFFIPQLGSQIYAMAGMETQLHLVADNAGDFAGLSANFSGPGFSDMTFRTLAMPQDQFDQWVQKVRAAPAHLNATAYKLLSVPSEANPVAYFSQVETGLFHSIVTEHDSKPMHRPMQMSSAMSSTEH
jgi:cytochrome o ubiquinol oxidase subunit 2